MKMLRYDTQEHNNRHANQVIHLDVELNKTVTVGPVEPVAKVFIIASRQPPSVLLWAACRRQLIETRLIAMLSQQSG